MTLEVFQNRLGISAKQLKALRSLTKDYEKFDAALEKSFPGLVQLEDEGDLKQFKACVKKIAKLLNITVEEAELLILKLLGLGKKWLDNGTTGPSHVICALVRRLPG